MNAARHMAAWTAGAGSYLKQDLRRDALAGLTVSIMGVPQAMAYALIAGLPPVYGLYTAIVPCIIAATLGSSKHLVTGPTNAMCMVIFSLTASMPQRYNISLMEIVLALTFLTGIFQFLFGFLKLGGIVRYVSNSVVVGFTAGAGILIASNQFKSLMGVHIPEEEAGHFLVTLWATFRRLHESNPYALAVGVMTILMLVGFRRWLPKLPGSLIALVVLSAFAWGAGWSEGPVGGEKVRIVRDIDEITSSFDLFAMPQMFLRPNLPLLNELVGGALALAILGLVESTSISRAIAASSGQRLDFNREFAAQGIAKMGSAFFSCFAASGSFTRSAVCFQSGGRTRMAAICSALFTAAILLAFGPLANWIPLPSLAGVIVVTAATMIERDRLVMTWRSGSNSRIVMGGTLAATLLMPLEIAIFAGVMLSIVLLLRITGRPDLTQLVQHPDYGFEEVPFNRAAPSPVAIINLEGDLYFAAAEDLDYELLQALKPETRVVVLRMKRLRAVGSSAMAMLEHFHKLLSARGIHLIVCGVEQDMTKVLTGSGLRRLIGEQNIFYADNRIFQSTELALARAMGIVEMQRAKTEAVAAAAQEETLLATTVGDVMQKRCLRFGSQHQLREAMWLVSQFQKRMRTEHPQTVFLQDLEGKLCAELSVRDILRSLAKGISEDNLPDSDSTLLAAIGQRLFVPITDSAREVPATLSSSAPLSQAFARAAAGAFRPVPVADSHGRLSGIFDEMAMLRGLTRLVKAEQERMDGPPPKSEKSEERTIPRT
jgi:sulfate permease, SulP family